VSTSAQAGGAFVLVSFARAPSPDGSDAKDWIHYQIAQGDNIVSGYRQGDVGPVRAYVERVVDALNERRALRRGRVNLVNDSTQPRATRS
jgi:hypothetical protein